MSHSNNILLSLSLSLSLSSLPPSLPQLPDTVNQELYSDSQLQVWAIIGLSELVSASYAEDCYGVVQRVSVAVVIHKVKILAQVGQFSLIHVYI